MSEPTTATGEPTVSLLLQDGSSRTYLVRQGSNILGRSNDADFRLPDTGVSRQHAEITWDGQVAVLVDLESTNGTTVNDEPVDNWMLADGDVITVGHSHIEVRIVEPRNERPSTMPVTTPTRLPTPAPSTSGDRTRITARDKERSWIQPSFSAPASACSSFCGYSFCSCSGSFARMWSRRQVCVGKQSPQPHQAREGA